MHKRRRNGDCIEDERNSSFHIAADCLGKGGIFAALPDETDSLLNAVLLSAPTPPVENIEKPEQCCNSRKILTS